MGKNVRYLADLKVINENAQEYAGKPLEAALTKQKTSNAAYIKRTGRTDIRSWVFTVGGQLGQHASADLETLARELGIQKEHLVATLYAIVLNAHSEVHAAYELACASLDRV